MNRVFVVTQGINPRPDAPWFVAERKPNGSLRRVKSDHLPMTTTREECEDKLLYWLWTRCTRSRPFENWLSCHGGREQILSKGVPGWAFR